MPVFVIRGFAVAGRGFDSFGYGAGFEDPFAVFFAVFGRGFAFVFFECLWEGVVNNKQG